MPQIFHRSFNTISLVSIYGSVFLLMVAGWAVALLVRSSYATNVGVTREQPVPFSHAHHVTELGIDCRYCHTSVETSTFAGIPATETCMSCHSQIWTDSPMLEPVRVSMRTNVPIRWRMNACIGATRSTSRRLRSSRKNASHVHRQRCAGALSSSPILRTFARRLTGHSEIETMSALACSCLSRQRTCG